MKKLLCVAVMALSTVGFAQDGERFGMEKKDFPKGINVGDKAPNVTLIQVDGNEFSLTEAAKKNPVVVFFYRGNWCPACNKQLSHLADSIDMITETGAIVVAISPESPAEMQKSAERTKSKINLLSDVNGEAMKSFDVDFYVNTAYQDKLAKGKDMDLAQHNVQDVAVLPVPATYIIGTDGKIIYRHFDINYTNRSSVMAVLNALK